jgi:hypothetical protein
LKIENIEVYGFRSALRGMRNPMESWGKSDTTYDERARAQRWWGAVRVVENPTLGPNDTRLALSLIKAGRSHRKFLRQIQVWWDITIPRAIWQEMDTYKVGTVRNSCSTMHKLGSRDLDDSDFENGEVSSEQLELINLLAAEYRADKTPERLWRLKMHLPESFLQKATYSCNYETALAMWLDRKGHRMPEWSGDKGICATILSLPYMAVFSGAAE